MDDRVNFVSVNYMSVGVVFRSVPLPNDRDHFSTMFMKTQVRRSFFFKKKGMFVDRSSYSILIYIGPEDAVAKDAGSLPGSTGMMEPSPNWPPILVDQE